MSASRISPLALDELDANDRLLMAHGTEIMGFLANDGLTFARVPGLLEAVSGLVAACCLDE
jgi:hypothetical protein